MPSRLKLIRLTPAKARRLKASIESEPGISFRSLEAAVRYMRKQFQKKS